VKKIFVFEGKHDVSRFRQVNQVDEAVYVNGASINSEVTNYLIARSKDTQIVIITDPDSAGNRIRRILSNTISNCVHIYLPLELSRYKKKIGFEHLPISYIEEILKQEIQEENIKGNLTTSDLWDMGLIGANSLKKRKYLHSVYNFYSTSTSTLLNRLNILQITKEELENTLKEMK
jgi:ribonuclease M5